MKTDHDLRVIAMMSAYGGGFVKALSECFVRADATNFAILRKAFDHYWTEYERLLAARDDSTRT